MWMIDKLFPGSCFLCKSGGWERLTIGIHLEGRSRGFILHRRITYISDGFLDFKVIIRSLPVEVVFTKKPSRFRRHYSASVDINANLNVGPQEYLSICAISFAVHLAMLPLLSHELRKCR
jgi:hypothetical protein